MAKLTKKQKEAVTKIDRSKLYSVDEASQLVKDITNVLILQPFSFTLLRPPSL